MSVQHIQIEIDNSSEIKGLDDELDVIYLKFESAPTMMYKIVVGSSLINKTDKETISTYLKTIIEQDSTTLNNKNGILLKDIMYDSEDEYKQYAIKLTMKYLTYYVDREEYKEPPKPITGDAVINWMSDPKEAELFGRYMHVDDSSNPKKISNNIILLKELKATAELANYMGMNKLLHKICSLVGHAIKGKDPETMQVLFPK